MAALFLKSAQRIAAPALLPSAPINPIGRRYEGWRTGDIFRYDRKSFVRITAFQSCFRCPCAGLKDYATSEAGRNSIPLTSRDSDGASDLQISRAYSCKLQVNHSLARSFLADLTLPFRGTQPAGRCSMNTTLLRERRIAHLVGPPHGKPLILL